MYCKNCGAELDDDVKLCPNCGSALGGVQPSADSLPPEAIEIKPKQKPGKHEAKPMMAQGEKISNNITLCNDGKYRWIYEMSLFKNPTIFFLIWKIFFFNCRQRHR